MTNTVTTVYISDDFGQAYQIEVGTTLRFEPALTHDCMSADSDWDTQDYVDVDIDWETIMVFDEDHYPAPLNLEQVLESLGITHAELADSIESRAIDDYKVRVCDDFNDFDYDVNSY